MPSRDMLPLPHREGIPCERFLDLLMGRGKKDPAHGDPVRGILRGRGDIVSSKFDIGPKESRKTALQCGLG